MSSLKGLFTSIVTNGPRNFHSVVSLDATPLWLLLAKSLLTGIFDSKSIMSTVSFTLNNYVFLRLLVTKVFPNISLLYYKSRHDSWK